MGLALAATNTTILTRFAKTVGLALADATTTILTPLQQNGLGICRDLCGTMYEARGGDDELTAHSHR